MNDTVNWDAVPDSVLLPEGMYRLSVEAIDEVESSNGKKMYKVTFRVVEGMYEGSPFYDNYVVGSDADPMAELQETRDKSIGIRTMKRLFKATQIPLSPRIGECIKTAIDQRFVAVIDLIERPARTLPDGRTFPKGEQNRITRMYPEFPYPKDSAVLASTAPAPAPAAPTLPGVASPKRTLVAAQRGTSAAPAGTVTCPECSEKVARVGFLKHMGEKHPE